MENEFAALLKDFMEEVEIKELDIKEENGFEITSDQQAGFMIRKLNEAREKRDSIIKTAKEERDRLTATIDLWEEKETKSADNNIEFLESLLRSYAVKALDGSDKKSLKLPFGTLAFKKQQPKYTYDDTVLLAYLETNGEEFISKKIVLSPNKVEIKKAGVVKEGNLYINDKKVDGIDVEILEDKFEVK